MLFSFFCFLFFFLCFILDNFILLLQFYVHSSYSVMLSLLLFLPSVFSISDIVVFISRSFNWERYDFLHVKTLVSIHHICRYVDFDIYAWKYIQIHVHMQIVSDLQCFNLGFFLTELWCKSNIYAVEIIL